MHRAVFPQAPGRPAMGAGGMGGWSPRGVLRRCRGTVSPAGSEPALLREPCEGCDRHSPAQGKVEDHRWGSCFSSTGDGDDGSCEVNGHRYRDGEIFQPHCRVRCRCEDGGFTCVPLCSEDVRLPSWDCPHPRRVEVPGKCCPEWVCDRAGGLGVQPLPAQGEC